MVYGIKNRFSSFKHENMDYYILNYFNRALAYCRVDSENHISLQLHLKFGFVQVARFKEVGLSLGDGSSDLPRTFTLMHRTAVPEVDFGTFHYKFIHT